MVPIFETAELNQYLITPSGYKHLDITLRSLAGGGYRWPSVRFKLGVNRGQPVLEFRLTSGWPVMFENWPSTERDRFGDVLRVTPTGASEFLNTLSTPKDYAMICNLFKIVALATNCVAGVGELEPVDVEEWREIADAFERIGGVQRETAV
jgi:hypothetical protein